MTGEREGDAKHVMDEARAAAAELGSPALECLHVLLAIARIPQSLAARNLARAGVDLRALEQRALELLPRARQPHEPGRQLPIDARLKQALELAATLQAVGEKSGGWTSAALLMGVLSFDDRVREHLAQSGVDRGTLSADDKSRFDALHSPTGREFLLGFSAQARLMTVVLSAAEARGDQALARELRRALLDLVVDPPAAARPSLLVTERRSRRLRAGTLCHVRLQSRILRGNPAGDPAARTLPVYVPRRTDAALPVVFLLIGFTGTGEEYLESHPWHPGVVDDFDRALQRGDVPPAILAMPNCFTKYGGSQYVNSSYLGNYEDHVVEELTVLVDEQFPTLAGRRAVVGKSSGGIGALHLAMRHPDIFPVAASISGDCGFEGCHAPAFWECLRALVPFDGDASRFVAEFLAHPDVTGDKFGAMNTIAMAACYSPNPASPIGCDLPIDTHTGERIESVWQRWLAFDPVHACERYADNLKRLELLHIECGLRDEYNIQWGTRQLAAELARLGVAHVHEEHDGGHRNIQERYLRVLPTVIRRLAAQG